LRRKDENDDDFKDETSPVDELFKVSSIGQSVFVPRAGQDVTDVAESKAKTPKKDRKAKQKYLMENK